MAQHLVFCLLSFSAAVFCLLIRPMIGSPKSTGTVSESMASHSSDSSGPSDLSDSSSSGCTLDLSYYHYEGSPADGAFAVMNTGTHTCTILSLTLLSGGLHLLETFGFPNTLAPGAVAEFAITASGDLRGTAFNLNTSCGTFGPYAWPAQ